MNDQQTNDRLRPGFLILMAIIMVGSFVFLWLAMSSRQGNSATASSATGEAVAPEETENAPVPARATVPSTAAPARLEEAWGIEIASVRLTMADSMIDLRYRLVNPEKAALLSDGKTPAYLLHEARGIKLALPNPSKEGGFPPTSQKQMSGRTYFQMVACPGGMFKRGDQLTVVIGGAQTTNLTLE